MDHLQNVVLSVGAPSTHDMSSAAFDKLLAVLMDNSAWWLTVVTFLIVCISINASVGYRFAPDVKERRSQRNGQARLNHGEGVAAALRSGSSGAKSL